MIQALAGFCGGRAASQRRGWRRAVRAAALGTVTGAVAGVTAAVVVACGAGFTAGLDSALQSGRMQELDAGDVFGTATIALLIFSLFGVPIGTALGSGLGAAGGVVLHVTRSEQRAPVVGAALSGVVFAWLPIVQLFSDTDPLFGLLWLPGIPVFGAIGYLAGRLFIAFLD